MTDIFKLIIGTVIIIAIGYFVYVWFNKKSEGFESCSYYLDLYYVDWCPHCTKILPIYNSLGSKLTIGDKNVEVSSFEFEKIKAKGGDAWENLRGRKDRDPINGFPTIRLYGPDEKMIAEFDGMRTKEGILDFLHRNDQLKN